MDLPAPIDALCDVLAAADGTERVVLGGSRATGTATEASDWDIGVHYRGDADFSAIAARGELHPPGSWGRLMNGGAWLDVEGRKVDVLLRDLDVVDHWVAEAEAGRYETDQLLGYIAGLPTYALAAELAHNVVLRGPLIRRPVFTDALAETGVRRWRFDRDFSLDYAAGTQTRGDSALTVAHLLRACLEEAHARSCERREWALNEKGLLAATGLAEAATTARTGAVDATAAALRT